MMRVLDERVNLVRVHHCSHLWMLGGENLLKLALPRKLGSLDIDPALKSDTNLFCLRLLAIQVLKSNIARRVGLHVRKSSADWERTGA